MISFQITVQYLCFIAPNLGKTFSFSLSFASAVVFVPPHHAAGVCNFPLQYCLLQSLQFLINGILEVLKLFILLLFILSITCALGSPLEQNELLHKPVFWLMSKPFQHPFLLPPFDAPFDALTYMDFVFQACWMLPWWRKGNLKSSSILRTIPNC